MIKSKQILGPVVIGASPQTATVPAGEVWTITQFMAHNTSASGATITGTVNSVQVFEALTIPASGEQPTIVYGMLGQRIAASQVLSVAAGTQDVITIYVSGIRETV